MTKVGTYEDVKRAVDGLMVYSTWFNKKATSEHITITDAHDGSTVFRALLKGGDIWICWYSPDRFMEKNNEPWVP